MPKRKPGRPKLPASKARTVTLRVSLSPEEARLVRAKARQAGARSVSQWARDRLLSEGSC